MPRLSVFNSPFLVGFDAVEELLDRVSKSSDDGYPPYNIERLEAADGAERLQITLAVAGFEPDELDISLAESQLQIRGRRRDGTDRSYLHRGIAARQFQRTFVLADGMDVEDAELENGLLLIRLIRPEPVRKVRKIAIRSNGA